ncbi:HIT family protein [Arthrobacter psychrochitiniphilus]|uniref:Diadenosine tetraphosphate hydrolase n=1 Tax=Arthrobacter psychrochitiniphilus TaxID=291045 RepID=A0A2V3DPQ9_9MICC|nr:HIT family protein [Arthrobacter psychrochitiniphilus]NYG18264.1 histidine triad (HIT) family protein [Arthrobacter psychrochitiniphilus]PXA64943.1 diadenosine tetraphosphate hydrolase [Arthrobacter psychrochitiniphilus]
MSTLFTKIINGDIPGRFIWKDSECVSFLTIGPLTDGHVLVVPRQEVDKWTDATPELLTHLMAVAQRIGQAQVAAFGAPRAGLTIAGFEVEHLHVHVFPAYGLENFDFGTVNNHPDPELMDASAEKIRVALRDAGHGEHVPTA